MNGPPERLTSCDREPIHIPGSIQPHGLLLVVSRESGRVVQGAGHLEEALGLTDWQDRPLADLLGEEAAAAILSGEAAPPRRLRPPLSRRSFDLSLVNTATHLLVELEPATPRFRVAQLLPILEEAAQNFDTAPDLDGLMQVAAREFRRLTGYDRVLVYRFLPDGAGKVVAEDRRAGLQSFMNHHFPAGDIPLQARALYVRNLVRVIPDVSYQPLPLRPAEPPGAPLDMSDCILRSVSPVHLQYMKNMGVAASASFSLVRDGTLWGMIACHHTSGPLGLARDVRNAGRALGGALIRQIRAREETESYRERMRLRQYEDGLNSVLHSGEDPPEAVLQQVLPRLQEMLGADGAVLLSDGARQVSGLCPPDAVLSALSAWLAERKIREDGQIFATHCLSSAGAPETALHPRTAGVCALQLCRERGEMLIWLRAEVTETIDWAGNPHKAAEPGPDGLLTPRASFESFRETVRDQARPWNPLAMTTLRRLADTVRSIRQTRQIRALNAELLSLVEEKEALLTQREFLLGEVNHRVQNSLTLVSGFLSMQARIAGEGATRSALEEARRRIAAVALVHRRLYGTDQVRMVDAARYVDELLEDLVSSIDPGWRRGLRRDLRPVQLTNDRAISLGLILTELFINANKYAYNGAPGPLLVTLYERDGHLSLTVRDQGVGHSGTREGFGSRMMAVLVQQLGGTLEFEDLQPGTAAHLRAPVEQPL